ncbi:hypothetical protein D1224_15665 [Henriciella barbarensis]|uniref:Uncharacterized protein n=1 Tax=Henriciella barbarensis TaxID=86342 RepID=A0A399QNV3_9PROT|nr:hypothetical protein [Henriciella barbarensis]RIJ20546.1 hypothetical protein D1224_15665 [Henriciella barbarensis]
MASKLVTEAELQEYEEAIGAAQSVADASGLPDVDGICIRFSSEKTNRLLDIEKRLNHRASEEGR